MDRVHSRRRSRSRSPVRKYDRNGSRERDRPTQRYRDRSHSPIARRSSHSHRSRSPVAASGGDRRGHGGNRVNPSPSRVLGIFGLSVHTSESHVRQIFSKFGPIDRMQLVYDTKTGRSRGFCFVYYQNQEDARAAKDQCSGMEIDRQRIRVDFSLTARAHSPTPGVYMGKSTRRHDSDGKEGDRDYNSSSHSRRSRRSPSPQYRRRRNRSLSQSPRMR